MRQGIAAAYDAARRAAHDVDTYAALAKDEAGAKIIRETITALAHNAQQALETINEIEKAPGARINVGGARIPHVIGAGFDRDGVIAPILRLCRELRRIPAPPNKSVNER